MQVLATISDTKRLALVVDLRTDAITSIPQRAEFTDASISGRPACRPFGITWSPDELYIANNRQLLSFDRRLDFQRISATRLQVNTHQIAYHAGRVWAASPWTNSLIGVSANPLVSAVEFDLQDHVLRDYCRDENTAEDDKYHFNSLLWADQNLFVAAHALGAESFINHYDSETFTLLNVLNDAGAEIHGLARHDGELFWLSTKTGELRSDAGRCLMLSRWGYARGFAVTRAYFIVGISEFLSRGSRHKGDSWIQVIDRRSEDVVHETRLRDTGSINDLRLLDEHDFAHRLDRFL